MLAAFMKQRGAGAAVPAHTPSSQGPGRCDPRLAAKPSQLCRVALPGDSGPLVAEATAAQSH